MRSPGRAEENAVETTGLSPYRGSTALTDSRPRAYLGYFLSPLRGSFSLAH